MRSFNEIMTETVAKRNSLTEELKNSLDPKTEEIRYNAEYDTKSEDGYDIYCKTCGERLTCLKLRGKGRCVCSCHKEKLRRENELSEAAALAFKIQAIRGASLLGERYKDATFEKTEVHSNQYALIYNRCRKYCDVAAEVHKRGLGIYLYGNSGTGKTHLTACMANQLMNSGYTTLFTNFAEIAKIIKSTYNNTSTETEKGFLEKLANVAFLFIDDFGTEIVKRGDEDGWLQEKVFDVINSRYNKKKPIVISSNYTMSELVSQRGVAPKTVDRIAECCEPMELKGASYRKKAKSASSTPF